MLSEIKQTEKDKYCNITYKCNLKKQTELVGLWNGGCHGLKDVQGEGSKKKINFQLNN